MITFVACGIFLAVVILGGYFSYAHFHQPLISSDISNKLTSVIYVTTGKNVDIQRATVKYDDSLKQLSYVALFENVKITISEQPSPEVFGDVPQYFDKWVESAGAVSNFETPNGKVYIASNPKYGVNSVAILNSNGTLLFAKPSANLTTDQWKAFFRNLKLQS